MFAFIDAHKRYGLKTVALRKLNLEIRPREFFVLYGPAGAGKSTVLNLLAGISRPTAGDIRRNDSSIVHLPPEKRGAAMAFENYALYSHLSVAENLAFPLRAQGAMGRADIEERVRQIASVLGIGHVLDRRPGQLSGGQRQRVALGRAIIRPADIYLLDEPIGHLDAKLRHRMRAELKALAVDMNATVLFTTTSSKEALALGDRVGVLNNGRLEQVGTPAELYHAPANTFVASFVGDPPMSFLSVTARSEENGTGIFTSQGHRIGLSQTPHLSTGDLRAGVRADAIRIVPDATTGAMPAKIEVLEHLGHSNIAVMSVGPDQLSVALPSQTPYRTGQAVWLSVDPGNVQLFMAEAAIEKGLV